MKKQQIVLTIDNIEKEEYFIPEYYYYDKNKHTIATSKGDTIPVDYLKDNINSNMQFPNQLRFPFRIGMFQAGKLIGFYDNMNNRVELKTNLTVKQKKKHIIYKVYNAINNELVLVNEQTRQSTIDIQPYVAILLETFAGIPTVESIEENMNQLIITLKNESNS